MDALAAGKALVLDELGAELIRSQHILHVLFFETDALHSLLQGASFFHHSSTPRINLCLQEMMHFAELGPSRTALCVASLRRGTMLIFSRRPLEWISRRWRIVTSNCGLFRVGCNDIDI